MKKVFSLLAYFFLVICVWSACGTKEDPVVPDNPDPEPGPGVPEVVVKEVRVSPESLKMAVGNEHSLSIIVLPEDAEYDKVLWSSTDESVVIVSETGKVSAVAEGTADVIAKVGDKHGKCHIEVLTETVVTDSIALSKTSLSLNEGETYTLTATVYPENATDKTVTWNSSDPVVASVDSNGKVTAIKAGTAIITATCCGKSAECKIKVKSDGDIDVSLNPWEDDDEDYGGTVK